MVKMTELREQENDKGYKRWLRKKGLDKSYQDFQDARNKQAENEMKALIKRGQIMDKTYVRSHPHVVVKDNWEPRECPDPRDPREWIDRKGNKHFGNKRYVVGAY